MQLVPKEGKGKTSGGGQGWGGGDAGSKLEMKEGKKRDTKQVREMDKRGKEDGGRGGKGESWLKAWGPGYAEFLKSGRGWVCSAALRRQQKQIGF